MADLAARVSRLELQVEQLSRQLQHTRAAITAKSHPQPFTPAPTRDVPSSSPAVLQQTNNVVAPKASTGDDSVDIVALATNFNPQAHLPSVMQVQVADGSQYLNHLTNTPQDIESAYNDNEKRARSIAAQHPNLASSVFYRCPADYYDWHITKRRDLLGAPSIHYLCKSLIMHNSKCDHESYNSKINSKYYCCVVQYSARLHNEKVSQTVRRLIPEPKPSARKFNFRLVDTETNDKLTGQQHNGVTPLGSRETVPIILSHKIAALPHAFLWLGGGEVDLKWKISVADFIRHFDPIIDDITYDDARYDDNDPIETESQ